jgi:hypothetical protein
MTADDVIPLRTRRSTAAVQPTDVDDWGRDPRTVGVVWGAAQLRWSVTLGGDQLLPRRGAALVVVNCRRFSLAPISTAFALADTLDRPVRFVGRPDIAPIGPLAQRLGGLLARPDEVTRALHDGDVVVMGAEPVTHPRRVGRVDHRLIGAAVATGAKVFPAATASAPFRRGARVEIGPALTPNRKRRGPLAELELADTVRERIGVLLGGFGGIATGTPIDWLPLSGMGGG